MDGLMFRRQYILTPEKLNDSLVSKWNCIKLANNYLYTHPSLEVNRIEKGENLIVLLGYMIDPFSPSYTNEDILKDLLKHADDFPELILKTAQYSGRWVMIHKNSETFNTFNDPCSLRQIYYIKQDNGTSLASQPHLLANLYGVPLSEDKDLIKYINSQYYINQEKPWFGTDTEYKSIKHLLPNHYLNLKTAVVKRFDYFVLDKSSYKQEQVIEIASKILQGSVEGMARRHKVMLAVTAGLDSRVLLAASKKNKNNILYYVSSKNKLTTKHMDIFIPKRLSDKLGLDLQVFDNLPPVRKDFFSILSRNVSRPRLLPKTLTIQYFYDNFPDYININGNASGIIKNAYGTKHPPNANITASYIMNKIECPKELRFVQNNIEKWLEGVRPFCDKSNWSIMDMFYWEQRMGNWGAMYQSEQDIAIEEFTPFSNRLLISLFFSTKKSTRCHPHYPLYYELINRMWAETLSEKVNPLDYKTKMLQTIKKVSPVPLIVFMKSLRKK